jgi:hypothetical protein
MWSNSTVLHAIFVLYLVASTVRILFYWPTYRAIVRCQNGASSSSALSTGYFVFSFAVTTLYFSTVRVDMWAALVSAANCLALSIITLSIMWKRHEAKRVAYSEEEQALLIDSPAVPPFLDQRF